LPFQERLRDWKDRLVGYGREPAKDRARLLDGLRMLRWMGSVQGQTLLEIGTGWQPMLPLLYALAGARVVTADLHRLVRRESFQAALDAVAGMEEEIAGQLGIGTERIREATRPCGDFRERLRELRITYLAPCDCRSLPLRAGAVDIVTSRAVFEHIPPVALAEIVREAARVLRPGGRMVHLIDYSDHWSHRDRRITAVNFLRYPDWIFRLTCIHPQNYQNRLRHPEYVQLFEEAGFTVTRQEKYVDEKNLQSLGKMKIDKKFRRFSPGDLAATRGLILAVLGGGARPAGG